MDPCLVVVLVLLRERFQPHEGDKEREEGAGCQATDRGGGRQEVEEQIPPLVRSSRRRSSHC